MVPTNLHMLVGVENWCCDTMGSMFVVLWLGCLDSALIR